MLLPMNSWRCWMRRFMHCFVRRGAPPLLGPLGRLCCAGLIGTLSLSADATSPEPPQAQPLRSVSGRAVLPQGATLPRPALFTVRVEDIARAGAPARLLSEVKQTLLPTEAALDFHIEVAPQTLDPRARYALRVSLHEAGQLRFTSTQMHPVLTSSAQPEKDRGLLIALSAVGPVGVTPELAPRPAHAALLNTYWKLVELDGQTLRGTPYEALGDFSLTLLTHTGRARIRAACGSTELPYQLSADMLTLDTVAVSVVAGP